MRKELTVDLKCHKMLKGSINTENLKLQGTVMMNTDPTCAIYRQHSLVMPLCIFHGSHSQSMPYVTQIVENSNTRHQLMQCKTSQHCQLTYIC